MEQKEHAADGFARITIIDITYCGVPSLGITFCPEAEIARHKRTQRRIIKCKRHDCDNRVGKKIENVIRTDRLHENNVA